MRLDGVELRTVELTLRQPLGTSAGVHHRRTVALVRVVGDGAEGWGEAGAMRGGTAVDPPLDEVVSAIAGHGIGRLVAAARANDGELPGPETVVIGDPDAAGRMAAAAVEMAVLDCGLRHAGRSLSQLLGTDGGTVAAGAVVGIPADRRLSTLLRAVEAQVALGYRRVRVKIEPGWDIEPLRAVRRAHPELVLQADANGSYRLGAAGECRAERLGDLDELELACLEQPLEPDDLTGHATLSDRFATPICLDESLTTLERLAEAIEGRSCRVACVKPARLGGLAAAVRAQEACALAGVAAFVGGFFETGLGRSANAALAGLPGFTLPGDLSDPTGYLEENPVAYPRPSSGRVSPPTAPGVAPPPDMAALDRWTTASWWFPATG